MRGAARYQGAGDSHRDARVRGTGDARSGKEIVLTTDYEFKGSAEKLAVSYPDLAKDVKPGSKILCADGSVTFTVLECDVAKGEVRCRLENSAKLGERKNMNLPGVNVNLPTITEKDRHD